MILFKGRPHYVLAFYVLAVVISLIVAFWSVSTGYKAVEGGEKPETAGVFFLYILLFTGLFLLLRRWIRVLLFVLEVFFLFSTAFVLFSLVNDVAGMLWALLLVLLRIFLPNNLFFRNLSVSIIAGVSAGLVGASLSPVTALLLYSVLIIYDFVSVFITGHMVKLAKSVEDIKEGAGPDVALGAGDLVLPLLFATSFVYSPVTMVASALSAILGVAFTFYCLKKLRHPLPALPYIGAVQLSLTALALSLSTLLL